MTRAEAVFLLEKAKQWAFNALSITKKAWLK
jgi:hypothetical protein